MCVTKTVNLIWTPKTHAQITPQVAKFPDHSIRSYEAIH